MMTMRKRLRRRCAVLSSCRPRRRCRAGENMAETRRKRSIVANAGSMSGQLSRQWRQRLVFYLGSFQSSAGL